jgi:hypothetical protein
MTGHTKEPWLVEMTEAPIGVPFANIHAHPDGGYEGIAFNTLGPAEANARRIVDCVNALANIPDPAAFVAAARGMADLVDWLCEYRDHAMQEHWDDLSQSLEAFRTATGEADND